ncbi:Peroxidase 27 [Bienertia sinuspersici]
MPIIHHSVNGYGLMVGFYEASCPQDEAITKKVINEVIAIAPSLSGPLLRLFFHDCFVRVSSTYTPFSYYNMPLICSSVFN